MIFTHQNIQRVEIVITSVIIFLILPIANISSTSIFAAVVINEIFPKTENLADEWIELYNNGNDSVSLDRWKIENTTGNQQSFTLNASSIISGHGFLTLHQSQYGFSLGKDGDTIRLDDSSGNHVDQQSYPGILGYNVAIGRSTDGAGYWNTCTTATPDQPNVCPTPIPTYTPAPTALPLPTNTPEPTATPYATDAPTTATLVTPMPTRKVLPTIKSSVESSASQSSHPFVYFVIIAIISIGSVWAAILGFIVWKKKQKTL